MTSPRSPQRNSGTALALLGILLAMGLLMGLIALVLPQILGLVLVVFGFFFLGVFHYLVWGWWLKVTPDQEDDDENGK